MWFHDVGVSAARRSCWPEHVDRFSPLVLEASLDLVQI